MGSSQRSLQVTLFAAFAVVVGAALWVGSGWQADAVRLFRRDTVPVGALEGSRQERVLTDLGLIHPVPNAGQYDVTPTESTADVSAPARRREAVGLQLYGLQPADVAKIPSTSAVPAAVVAEKLPVVSIVALHDDLRGAQRGIFKNIDGRGKNWERRAYVSFFDNGELRFATGAGLRLHGGVTRHLARKSLRVYLRPKYGTKSVSAREIFGDGEYPVREFVLDAAYLDGWQMVDPIALEIGAAIGALAPKTRLVRYYLNGKDQGVYAAMERVSSPYLKAHYGHDRFSLYRYSLLHNRMVQGRMADYAALYRWGKSRKYSFAEAAERVDIENLSLWAIVYLLALPRDSDQGTLLRDETVPGARWFWVLWDLDHSFGVDGVSGDRPWEIVPLEFLHLYHRVRPMIYNYLREKSPEFREYFTRLFTEVLNHRLPPRRVEALLEKYDGLARDLHMNDVAVAGMATIRRVLTERPPLMRRYLTEYFGAGEPFRVRVNAPAHGELTVDGYRVAGDYEGWYFSNTPVKIAALSSVPISGWRLNGVFQSGAELRIANPDRDTVVEPVTEASSG